MKDRIKKYPFNPAYYRAHNDICKRRDTKRLYFSPLRIDLPHGRGAGATSFCAIEAILAVEKSVIENQKPQKPKKRLPYYVAKQNDTSRLRNVLVIVPEPFFVESEINYFLWALKKLHLEEFYTINRRDKSIIRVGTKNRILIVTPAQLRGLLLRKFTFFIIDELTSLQPWEFSEIFESIRSLASAQNKILLVSYNPRFTDDWLGWEVVCYKGDVNYKRYHADYRSMPKAWLGKHFFIEAKMLKEANPKAYSEEYLGLPYKDPDTNVPHGTFRGKKKIAGKQKTKKQKEKING